MPRISPDADKPFPRLDKTRNIPLGLAILMSTIAAREWPLREAPPPWLQSLTPSIGHQTEMMNTATFIWSLRGMRKWIGSDEQVGGYDLASKRVHFLPRLLERKRHIFTPTVELYSERGGQRLEALMALGFSFACGKDRHSWKVWSPMADAICHLGLGRPRHSLPKSEDRKLEAHRHFKALGSRLNTARAELGAEQVQKRALDTFAALRLSAFSKV